MDYTYFPGCSVKGLNKSYEISALSASKVLGVNLLELNDWNCCGATAYMSIYELRAHILAARNLALAEKYNRDIATICPACYVVLDKTNRYICENKELRENVNAALGEINLKYYGSLKVRHLLDIIVNDVGEEAVKSKVTAPLKGLKVAPYYGCQTVRPFGAFDDKENPQTMEQLLRWIGAEPVKFPLKAKCCGGMQRVTNEEAALKLIERLLKAASRSGADCIATACPLCQMNLEASQDRVNSIFGTHYSMPTLYFTQLLGLAFGRPIESEVALGQELVAVDKIIEPYKVSVIKRER
ncbi:CoB--CoM heterodisulfide reductase iron-sulfur subunit B family protein [Candidatus Hecatella orcuttiae]|uniref:CoB--CoM heterodisulfide reductase iron-sulfur subunit B family protein n=1 Tax=Candidatus Hecatella orcuttiae TaxID=1935119 RepID=UPI002867C550|nr:CoB--CoM heterodisulfide reductase iron-sulfur subunit B family protein [Candidatus Hecatella orcuttiae]